ncbi:serine hydrolase domain-containing protein [Candidatus Electronema sp. JC]|uniref:serine hydrolase domain-containing protein n=1 Tax=Candidatus Electronema sp. JC TaxID=3401570 RepID=UPI003B43625A
MNRFLRELLTEGISGQVFHGAAAAVACGSGPARHSAFAYAGVLNSRDRLPVTADSLFDLASLSKALSTALLCFSLFAEGNMSPDSRLAELLPDEKIPPDKAGITLRSLLSHSSGLAAYQPWFRDFAPAQNQDSKARLLRLILNEPLAYAPGSCCLYSDLGFILLGHLLATLTGKDLATNFREQVTLPLGLDQALFYCPAATERSRCAATEACAWRGRVIQGEVHDEHCWLLGGAAGHAGLFGTAAGVLRLCGAILDGWLGKAADGCAWAAFLPEALRPQLPGQTWCMGFDTPSVGASSSGSCFSPASVGHLGFTGTSFWMDPERELIVVLLSNRVHPSRDNTRIRQFRPFFHDALWSSQMVLGDLPLSSL